MPPLISAVRHRQGPVACIITSVNAPCIYLANLHLAATGFSSGAEAAVFTTSICVLTCLPYVSFLPNPCRQQWLTLSHARPCLPCTCPCPCQLIESALPKLPRDAGVTAHWLCINGVQPDLPENITVAAPPSKRRQLLGPAAPGTRAGALQEAAAAAAAAAGAGVLYLPVRAGYLHTPAQSDITHATMVVLPCTRVFWTACMPVIWPH